MIYGFCLLAIFGILAGAIAVGDVQEKTSYGLTPILMVMALQGEKFAAWAFQRADEKGKTEEK